MSTEVMHRAATILREAAESEEGVAAIVVLTAAFTALSGLNKPDTDETKIGRDERFRRLILDAANILSPICPHCQKRLGDPTPPEPK